MSRSTDFLRSQRKWVLVYGILYALSFVAIGAVGAVIAWRHIHG